MIEVTTAGSCIGAEKRVLIDIDKITLLQRQTPATGNDFTAIFLSGMPPYSAVETPDEIRERIFEARRHRAKLMTFFGMDFGKEKAHVS
jgi:hypothetical protein